MYFSIIIPLFNKAESIALTINSILRQGFYRFEVIVVDDGSTDGSEEVIKQFDDPRVRLITQKNGGVSSARNHGIRVGHCRDPSVSRQFCSGLAGLRARRARRARHRVAAVGRHRYSQTPAAAAAAAAAVASNCATAASAARCTSRSMAAALWIQQFSICSFW